MIWHQYNIYEFLCSTRPKIVTLGWWRERVKRPKYLIKYKFTWSFEHIEFVSYSTRVLGSKGWAVGRGIGPPLNTPLIAGFRSLDTCAPAPTPLTDCRLAVCVAVLADSPSVTSIGLISGGHENVTFVTTGVLSRSASNKSN
jgi:hypothetical protein